MPTGMVWTGLEELKEALRNLPADLTGEATDIVFGNADDAASEIRSAYEKHRRSGDLANKVRVKKTSSAFTTKAVVSNTSKIAFIYENGTEARHYVTKKGVRHALGRGPAHHTFIPAIERHRRVMIDRLKHLLERHGLLVSGDA